MENPKKYTVFLVDDDTDDLENLKDVFDHNGCAGDLRCFVNVEAVLATVTESTEPVPDLIVLDHQAPGLNGSDAVVRLRADDRYQRTALVVYSSQMTPTRQKELAERGADLSMAKAMTIQEMQQHVAAFCQAVENRRAGQ